MIASCRFDNVHDVYVVQYPGLDSCHISRATSNDPEEWSMGMRLTSLTDFFYTGEFAQAPVADDYHTHSQYYIIIVM